MKAVRTIVATAVIVFALTTVAMAGVQRLSGPAGDGTQAGDMAAAAPQPTAAQPVGGVTLSARQFAALLRAVDRNAAQDRSRDRAHARDENRDRDQTQKHDRQQTRTHSRDAGGSGVVSAASHHTTTTRSTAHQATTHGGGTHDGGSRDGGHNGGCD